MNATTHATQLTSLENGAVMGRAEFHRLYEECEGLRKVELIEGVVYTPSPEKFEQHSRQNTLLIGWLLAYQDYRPGDVEASVGGSILLDDENEPIPDAMLFRLRLDRFEDGYVSGAPELIIEIANTSVSRDLHQKKEAYRRNGVIEYIVWRVRDGEIDWFQLRNGEYERRIPDPEGVIESEVFPGLRLDLSAALAIDRRRLLAAVRPPGESVQ